MRNIFKIALLAASACVSVAHAQDATDENIVVTATRAPASVQTLPAEVNVIDVEAARDRGVTTLAETLREAPGLNVVATGGAGQQTSLFAGGGNSNHTLVLFDGLRINDPSSPGSAFDAGADTTADLGRIEVVEGPMSAVYGSDAIGGVVNLVPRHGGPGLLNMRLEASGGTFDTVSAAASADGTVGSFRYAISGEGFATDGYDLVPARMSTHNGERDGAHMGTFTGLFDYAATEALAFDLLVRRRRAQADFDAFDAFTDQRLEDDNLEISRNDLDIARLGATWSPSQSLSLRATYGGINQHRAQTDDGVSNLRYEGERRIEDITLNWQPGDVGALTSVALVAGASDEREQVNIYEFFGFPPASTVDKSENHQSGFVTAQGSLQNLTVTAAARIDAYDGFGAHDTWRVGASYALSSNARIYGAYGTSFRAPTLYERFVSFGDPDLNPEEGKSWEAGADAHFAAFGRSRGLELGTLYRHTDIRDLIDFGPSFTYANVKRAVIDTAEARISVHPLDWLTARVAYVYTDAQDDIAHTQLLRRPKDYWTADLDASFGSLHADLSWRQVGERADRIYDDLGTSLGVGTTAGYDVVRLSLGYNFSDHAEIYLAADNLADETYEPVNAFAGAPRSVMIGVRLRN